MHQNLVYGLIDPVLTLIFLTHTIQKQYSHKERVNPHLIFVKPDSQSISIGTGHMLESAFFCSGQTTHQPVSPFQT